MLVAMVLAMGILAMTALLVAYRAHALFLRARGVVAGEVVSAITADFNRALAAVLALYTRACYNSTRFATIAEQYPQFAACDIDAGERVAENYLNFWADAVRVVYAEHGVQLAWRKGVADVTRMLGRRAYVVRIMRIDWREPTAGSYAYARLRLNLTAPGLYNWERDALIGLTLEIDVRYLAAGSATVRIRVLADNGTYYGLLLARGWADVYLSGGGQSRWVRAEVKDVTYEGLGYYRLGLGETLSSGARVRVVVSDERGIVVVAEARVG